MIHSVRECCWKRWSFKYHAFLPWKSQKKPKWIIFHKKLWKIIRRRNHGKEKPSVKKKKRAQEKQTVRFRKKENKSEKENKTKSPRVDIQFDSSRTQNISESTFVRRSAAAVRHRFSTNAAAILLEVCLRLEVGFGSLTRRQWFCSIFPLCESGL